MDVYAHEKEQIDSIKEWWRENRWYIVAGLVISAAVVGGWRFWQEYRQEQAESASQKYETLVTKVSLNDLASVEALATELQESYAGTPYAALGTLKLAAVRVDAGEFEQATDALRWAMDNADDAELALVARLRLARVLLQLDRFGEVPVLLDAADPGKFTALYAEVKGDALLLGGDRDGARAAYETALAALEPGLGDRRTLQMKLDNLAMPLAALALPAADAPVESAAEPESQPEPAIDEENKE